jgi:hypothetical protein
MIRLKGCFFFSQLTLPLLGCATNKIIEPESTGFNFYFDPPDDNGVFTTIFELCHRF